ncbi:MAG: hypothetical protein JWO71_1327 [Candidatus Acidoferrum typicum]|nr:hypothetical protein [Candidatus Acidoferrum typicum]
MLCRAVLVFLMSSSTMRACFAEVSKPIAVVKNSSVITAAVKLGEQARAAYEVQNVGNEGLAILSVQSPCSCIVVHFDSFIPPKRTGSVEVMIDTRVFGEGEVVPFYVKTNDSKSPSLRLTATVKTMRYVEIRPNSFVTFGDIQRGKGAATSLQLSSSRPDFQPTVDTSAPYLSARLGEVRAAIGMTSVQLFVSIASDAPKGIFNADVVVLTGLQEEPEIHIPIGAFLTSAPQKSRVGTPTRRNSDANH